MDFQQKTSTKVNYPVGAYAPGHYMNTCYSCSETYTGDKYSRECEPCAINNLKKYSLEMRDKNVKLEKALQDLKNVRDVLNKIKFDDE